MTERLLKRQEVEDIVGLGRSTIYRRMAAGDFPKPLDLGGNCVRWRASEIDAWISNLGRPAYRSAA